MSSSSAQFLLLLLQKMLRFMIFCHVWFLQTRLIRCSENSTDLQAESFSSAGHLSPPAVIQFSVPKDLQLCLLCSGFDGSDVVWTHQDRKTLVTRHGSYETNLDRQRYLLRPGGRLCLLQLDDSDSGEYRCNQQLVAELQVLTGQDFLVSAGRTLLLPCRVSERRKLKWFHRRKGGKWEPILTRFKNGTVKLEREGGRYSLLNDALQILDLQPDDAGEYRCNRELQAKVTVLTVNPKTTRTHSATSTTADTITDLVDIKRKEKKRPENALVMVAVISLGLMILLMVSVCVLLTSMKCRRKRKYRRAAAAQNHEDTELQPWTTSNSQTECEELESPSPAEEMIHYASLGRQNWRERPSRSPPHQNHHNVIYSAVITRPAAISKQKHTQTHTGMKFYI